MHAHSPAVKSPAASGKADLSHLLAVHPYPSAPAVVHGTRATFAGISSQNAGSVPQMRAYVFGEHGWLEEEASQSRREDVEPMHEEPGWRVPASSASMSTPPSEAPLVSAVLRDDLAGLSALLKRLSAAALINAEDATGSSALDHAVDRKNFEAVKLLVRHGAKFDDVQLLDPQLLFDLITAGDMEFAREVAAYRQRVKALYHRPDDHLTMKDTLFLAITAGDVVLVSLIADAQLFALRDQGGANALHYAVISPNPLMLTSLLARLPADAHQKRQLLNLGRADGRTPLMQAIRSNRSTAVAVLLRAGASPDVVDVNIRHGDALVGAPSEESLVVGLALCDVHLCGAVPLGGLGTPEGDRLSLSLSRFTGLLVPAGRDRAAAGRGASQGRGRPMTCMCRWCTSCPPSVPLLTTIRNPPSG